MYAGDLVVGADGVHGVTHGEMCRNMTRSTLPPKPNDCTVTPSYSGIFGTSVRTAGLAKGVTHRTYGHRFCFIVTVGKDERVHWYLAIRRGQHPIRHYEKRDVDRFIQPYLSVKVAKGEYFDQIYQKCISCCHVPLEEALQPRWAWGRFVCIGDAVHKVCPYYPQHPEILTRPLDDPQHRPRCQLRYRNSRIIGQPYLPRRQTPRLRLRIRSGVMEPFPAANGAIILLGLADSGPRRGIVLVADCG